MYLARVTLALFTITFLIILSHKVFAGDYYKWVDERGNKHFADSLLTVPPQYRRQALEKNYQSMPSRSTVKEMSGGSDGKFGDIDKPGEKQKRENNIGKRIPGSGHIAKFTDVNFKSKVLNARGLTMVDFWAAWCGPCIRMEPAVKELAREYGNVKIGKLNIDENRRITKKYLVGSIPTFIFFKNGSVVKKVVGTRSKRVLKKIIEENI